MSEYSFPFKSINGDRLYKAEGWRNALRPLYTQGVFPIDPQLQVTAGTGMTVSISAGFAFLDGVTYHNDAGTTKEIDAADGVLNRKDRVCVRINEEDREATIVILKGTPSAVATAPSIVRDQDYYDICLAVIDISAGITSIANTHITDTRLDTDVCGIAAPFTVPDTSGWYDNWNDEYIMWMEDKRNIFASWFETLQNTLDSNQAANLYNLIVAAQSTAEGHATRHAIGGADQITPASIGAESQRLQFVNVVVAAVDFVEEETPTYADYPYRAAVALTGVLETMTPEVVFGVADATSGSFAPVVESYDGGIYVYASEAPTASVTIPTIILWKAVGA